MRIDGRTLDHATLETFRKLAVQRVLDGERPAEVVRSLGMNRTSIYRWLSAYRQTQSLSALDAHKSPGPAFTLSPDQERQVFAWLNGHTPQDYGYAARMWSCAVVADLIRDRLGASLSINSTWRLLKRLGLSFQKPQARAAEQDADAIRQWEQQDYPKLLRQAQANGAAIYFWDEAGFRSDAVSGRTWGVKGQTPVLDVPARRQKISAASAVDGRGTFWFHTYTGALTVTLFITLLQSVCRRRRDPIYLILDNLPVHKSSRVQDYVASTHGKLTLIFLPPYAPQTNPDELAWAYIKSHGQTAQPLKQGESLEDHVLEDLYYLQQRPDIVRAFFQHPDVAYAAK